MPLAVPPKPMMSAARMPPLIVTGPSKVLELVRRSVPAPVLVRPTPVPIMSESICAVKVGATLIEPLFDQDLH
jgi:hypothetical protein